MPSFYEGLPVVSAETQCACLNCVFSDEITSEADITGNCKFLSLSDSAKLWAEEILRGKDCTRRNIADIIKKAGYDITEQTKWLEAFYLNAK